MVKPGYFVDEGKVSFTRPAFKVSFCPEQLCCEYLENADLVCLIQFETGTSGGNVVLHCDSTGMTLDPDPPPYVWRAEFSWPDCIHPDPFEVVFTCEDQGPVNAENCFQVFGVSFNPNTEYQLTLPDEDNCCCPDSDEGITGVDVGPGCLVGGAGTLWKYAHPHDIGGDDATGCEGATWAWIDRNSGSFPIVWIYELDEYGNACCQPSPCPDGTHCPANPCAVSGKPSSPDQPVDFDFIPPELRWLRDLGE